MYAYVVSTYHVLQTLNFMEVKIIYILFTEGFPATIRGLEKEKILTEQFMETMNNNKIVF